MVQGRDEEVVSVHDKRRAATLRDEGRQLSHLYKQHRIGIEQVSGETTAEVFPNCNTDKDDAR